MLKRLAFVCLSWLLASAALAEVTAIRAGRLIDPETGRAASNQVILIDGEKITAVGANVADSRGRHGHRPFGPDRPAGPRRHPHAPRHHLQGHPGARLLLPDLRHRLDAAARHPGGLERHPAPELRLHRGARSRQQRPLHRHGPARGHRAGLDPGPDAHSLRNHHRRQGRAVLADTGDVEVPRHRLPRVPRSRHARRDREGRAREHALRREGHQDLRRLQALGLHRGRHEALHYRSRPRAGSRSPATCRRPRAPAAPSRPESGRSSTAWP